jgi:YgiT-type zinc finger domain-containing protein
LCQGSQFSEQTIDHAVISGHDVGLVAVRVMVCDQCGEQFTDETGTDQLAAAKERLDARKQPLWPVGIVYRM